MNYQSWCRRRYLNNATAFSGANLCAWIVTVFIKDGECKNCYVRVWRGNFESCGKSTATLLQGETVQKISSFQSMRIYLFVRSDQSASYFLRFLRPQIWIRKSPNNFTRIIRFGSHFMIWNFRFHNLVLWIGIQYCSLHYKIKVEICLICVADACDRPLCSHCFQLSWRHKLDFWNVNAHIIPFEQRADLASARQMLSSNVKVLLFALHFRASRPSREY